MKVNDAVTGLVLFVCAIAIFVYARSFPAIPGQPYGAGAFPTVIALGLGGFSALLVWRAFDARRRTGAREPLVALAEWTRDPRTAGNFLLALVLVLVYVFASETVGFILLSIGILLLMFWRTGVRPLTGVIVAVVMSLVIQVAFADFLRVPLPRGLLDNVLW
jgi:putative tricarboxylic transport membrane protein